MIPEEASPALIPCIGCGLFVLIVLMNIYARTNRVSSFMVVLASLGLAVFPWGLPLGHSLSDLADDYEQRIS
jgi:hypothetical protein